MQYTGGDRPERQWTARAGSPPLDGHGLPDPTTVELGTLARADATPEKLWKTVLARQIVRDDGDEYWDDVTAWVPANIVTPAQFAQAKAVHRRWRITTWVLSVLFAVVAIVALSSAAVPDWIVVPPAALAILAGVFTQRAANTILRATLTPDT